MNAMAYWDMSDVYLVSYPKSGTTWVCLILANILKRIRSDARRIDFFSVHDYVPDLHANPERISQLSPPRVIKTHENFDEWYRRIGLRGGEVVLPRVIYLVRDGREAIVSYYHYVRALHGYRGSFPDFLRDNRMKRDDWGDHVSKWLIHNDVLDKREALLMRYERLRSDTMVEVKRMIDFIGIEASEIILQEAIKESDITKIRELEEKYGGGVRYKDRDYRFARKGSQGEIEEGLQREVHMYYKNNLSIFQFLGYE